MFKNFFKRKAKLPPIDMARIGVDIHSHLIPGIDDGAADIEESLQMIRRFSELGYRKLITTPHIMSDYYRNTKEVILKGCEQIRNAAEHNGITIDISAAAEYYLDTHFLDLINKKEILTFGDQFVLFELSFISEPIMLDEAVFNMQMEGYKPVLAHVERYNYWHRKQDRVEELIEKGVMMQLNINSLTGYYSPQVLKASRSLVEKDLITFIGSDCHRDDHLDVIEHARTLPLLHRLVDSDTLLNRNL